jgi:hypothetical protein
MLCFKTRKYSPNWEKWINSSNLERHSVVMDFGVLGISSCFLQRKYYINLTYVWWTGWAHQLSINSRCGFWTSRVIIKDTCKYYSRPRILVTQLRCMAYCQLSLSQLAPSGTTATTLTKETDCLAWILGTAQSQAEEQKLQCIKGALACMCTPT